MVVEAVMMELIDWQTLVKELVEVMRVLAVVRRVVVRLVVVDGFFLPDLIQQVQHCFLIMVRSWV